MPAPAAPASGPQRHQLPAGIFRAVSLGRGGGCAIRDDGELRCWGQAEPCDGEDRSSLPVPVGGRWDAIAGSPQAGCAIDGAGALTCWGCARASDAGIEKEPARIRRLSRADEQRFCGVRWDGKIAGCEGFAQTTVSLDQSPPTVGVIAVDACWYSDAGPLAADACAILDDGRLDCWGLASYTREDLRRRAGPFTAVAVGACRNNVCMVKEGRVECIRPHVRPALPLPVTRLVAGDRFFCAIAAGQVSCFDSSGRATPDVELQGPARDVAADGDAACMVGDLGGLRCSGGDYTRATRTLDCGP
jgi:hypothetical protein